MSPLLLSAALAATPESAPPGSGWAIGSLTAEAGLVDVVPSLGLAASVSGGGVDLPDLRFTGEAVLGTLGHYAAVVALFGTEGEVAWPVGPPGGSWSLGPQAGVRVSWYYRPPYFDLDFPEVELGMRWTHDGRRRIVEALFAVELIGLEDTALPGAQLRLRWRAPDGKMFGGEASLLRIIGVYGGWIGGGAARRDPADAPDPNPP